MENVRNTKYMTKSDVVNDWLKQYEGTSGFYKHREGLLKFFQWLGKTPEETIAEYKKTKDRDEWARDMGNQVVLFYKDLIKKGYSINASRTWTIPVRSFFRDKATQLKIRRGAISRPQIASDEHSFLLVELQQMYHVANLHDKTLLALGVCLGYSSKDFLELKRSTIEKLVANTVQNKIDFPSHVFRREKTDVQGVSFLTPEAVRNLELYLKTVHTTNDKLFDLSADALNDHLKTLVKMANIQTKGQVKWHLLRKFLFTNLLKGMDILSAKIIMGKKVESDLATYMQQNEEELRQKFIKVYPFIKLESNGNGRVTRIEEMVNVMAQALARVISKELKEQGVMFRTDEDPIEILQKYVTSLEKRHKERMT